MIYPKLINVKRTNLAIKILLIISVAIGGIVFLINELTNEFKWSFIVMLGIVYVWVTVLYSIRKNINIAAHVLIQTIAISVLVVLLDEIIGFRKWSLEIAFPIVVGISNITIFILTIVSRKKYFRYALYQFCIFCISIIPVVLYFGGVTKHFLPMTICSGIALFTFINTIILCGRDLKQELVRLFHI